MFCDHSRWAGFNVCKLAQCSYKQTSYNCVIPSRKKLCLVIGLAVRPLTYNLHQLIPNFKSVFIKEVMSEAYWVNLQINWLRLKRQTNSVLKTVENNLIWKKGRTLIQKSMHLVNNTCTCHCSSFNKICSIFSPVLSHPNIFLILHSYNQIITA